jgi:putative aminopeptidase FrvX
MNSKQLKGRGIVMFEKLKNLSLAETKHLIKNDDYIYINNGADILGVAHCDTVFDRRKTENFYFENENFVFSPKLDDRAGMFTLMFFLPKYYPDIKFDILFTTNEEKGASTAENFRTVKKYNWIFEFDRQGSKRKSQPIFYLV